MYKFEIYRNVNIPDVLDGIADKSRYNLDDYVFDRELKPLWDDLSFSWEKESGRAFFRKGLKGSYSLIDNDYDWANGIRQGEYEINRYRYLKVSEKVDGLWAEQWKGFFNIADGEWDFTRCHVKFEPSLTLDEYSAYIENIKQEKNLIDISPTVSVFYDIADYSYYTSVTTQTEEIDWICGPPFMTAPQAGELKIEASRYLLYRKSWNYGWVNGCDAAAHMFYYLTYEYRRDYIVASIAPVGDWIDSGLPLDPSGNKTWVRYYRGIDSPSYEANDRNVFLTECDGGCWIKNVDYILDGVGGGSEVENERGRLLTSAIARVVDSIDPSGTSIAKFKSNFLYDVTNPFTEEVNTLNDIVLWQLTDMRDTSDAATKGMYSLNDIERFILPFNAYWYIDGDGHFRVEHQKYFDNGLSYSGTPFNPATDLDLSSEKLKTVINYSDDLPQTEMHKFAYSNAPDFEGLPIRYSGNIVDRKEDDSTREYNFGNIATDLTNVTTDPDGVGEDGFFMATTYYDGSILRVHEDIGILSNVNNWNVYMSVSSLQEKYWKWGRSISYGTMNGELTDFTQKRVLIHSDIVVANCNGFNPYKLVRTDFGDGKVEEAELTLKDKKLTLTLSY